MYSNTILDIGSETIKILQIIENKKSGQTQAFFDFFPSDGVTFGYISNKNKFSISLKKAVKTFEKKYKTEISEVLVALNDFGISSTKISTTKPTINQIVSKHDLEEIYKKSEESLRAKNKDRIIEREIVRYKLNEIEHFSNPIGLNANKITVEYFFVTMPENNFTILEEVLSENDISAEIFVPALYGLSEIALTKINKKLGSAVVDFGDQKTSILIYEDEKPIYYNVLKIGSKNITKKISEKLTVDFAEAEKIKKQKVYSRKQKQIVDDELKVVAEKIKKEIEKANIGEILPDGIILSGQGSNVNDIQNVFKKVLNLPVKVDNKKSFDQSTVYNIAYGVFIYISKNQNKSPIKDGYNFKNILNPFLKIVKKFSL